MRTETSARSSAAYDFGCAATRIVAFVALCGLSAGASAQSCAPATPRTDPGTGFAPFGANEQVIARRGKSGRPWEWAVGTNTKSRRKVHGSLDWTSDKIYSWKIVNSGTGSEMLEIRDAGTLVLSLNYPTEMDAGNALELRVSTKPSIRPGTTIAATLTTLNGYAVSGSLSQSATRARSEQAIYYYFPQMAQGFTAEGTVSLTYPRKPPSGSRVKFTVRAGTIPCSSTGDPPTVSISAPAANSVFSAPATIAVIADAQDSGTVAQVAFYANGNPIGTATSNPYAIQWPNVEAGTYSLSAVATDNDGLQTTSAEVPIKVNAAQALYFIHVDHLNAPRLIADQIQKTVWRWEQQEPFGANSANEDLDGNSVAFELPLRLPGQYYDTESGNHYNVRRDYDPSTGRYIESDPVGLKAGLNTYAYVANMPLAAVDPSGLALYLCIRSCCGNRANHGYLYDTTTKQCCGDPADFPRQSGRDYIATCSDKNRGPTRDVCWLISSSDDDARKALRCCNRDTGSTTYLPVVDDCQDRADSCIRELQMAPPNTPAQRRFMRCRSCYRQ